MSPTHVFVHGPGARMDRGGPAILLIYMLSVFLDGSRLGLGNGVWPEYSTAVLG